LTATLDFAKEVVRLLLYGRIRHGNSPFSFFVAFQNDTFLFILADKAAGAAQSPAVVISAISKVKTETPFACVCQVGGHLYIRHEKDILMRTKSAKRRKCWQVSFLHVRSGYT
jgi:hypothetical protein